MGRLDGKTQQQEIVAEIKDIQRLLSKLLLERVTKQNNLTEQQMTVLKILAKSPMQMNEIAHELLVSSPNITNLIDRMEKKGIVKRGEDCRDRRKIEIQLTPQGERLFEIVREQYREILQKSFSVLAPEEATDLLRLLKKLRNEISRDEGS